MYVGASDKSVTIGFPLMPMDWGIYWYVAPENTRSKVGRGTHNDGASTGSRFGAEEIPNSSRSNHMK
jgi:hypothetical protein